MIAIQLKGLKITLVAVLFVLFGCSAAFDLAHTGAGQSAQVEKISFFRDTDNLVSNKNSETDLPDLFYISPNVDLKKYKKVMINDFTSITSDVGRISGLQIPEFKNMRKDIPDNIAQSFDGSVFSQCIRSIERIDHKDINSIKDVQADAILFGNISELKSGIRMKQHGGVPGLTAAQVEIKFVDRKTGEELIKMISRNTTDGDKVSIPILRRLSNLIKKAADNQPVINKPDSSSANNNSEEIKVIGSSSSKPENADVNKNIQHLTVVKKTNIRAINNTKSKIIIKPQLGEKLIIIDESGDWFKVKTDQGKSGWILKRTVKKVE